MAKKQTVPLAPYLTKNPNGTETGYIRLTPSLVHSDAFKTLTPLAAVVYIDMLIIAKGHDKVIYSQSMAEKSRGISKAGYTSSMRQLENVGFVRRMPRACYDASCYQFDVRWRAFSRTDNQSTM